LERLEERRPAFRRRCDLASTAPARGPRERRGRRRSQPVAGPGRPRGAEAGRAYSD